MLLAVIHLAAPAPPKWDEVAELMGGSFTGNAIRYVALNLLQHWLLTR